VAGRCEPPPGQSQCVHEVYALILRGVIEQLLTYICDLHRRDAGRPVTAHWLDSLRPSTVPPKRGKKGAR
jgi:hypothetical protein